MAQDTRFTVAASVPPKFLTLNRSRGALRATGNAIAIAFAVATAPHLHCCCVRRLSGRLHGFPYYDSSGHVAVAPWL